MKGVNTMSYIYKIYNDMNDKLYIGLTNYDNPIDRWTRHLQDYQTAGNFSKRPLYEAMKKYGVDKFHFEIIEETDNPQEREKYWIETLRTYIGFEDCKGYNATLGGDGHSQLVFSEDESQKIISLFTQGNSCKVIAVITHHSEATISKYLKDKGYEIKSYQGSLVGQFTKEGDFIQSFPSAKQAAEFLNKKGQGGHITEVCNGHRKSAYGYIWKYI